MKLERLGEFGLIRRLKRRLPPAPPALRQGIGDDAAVWDPSPGRQALATCDLLIEGVHFDLKTSRPWQLGAKAAAASLSDIAAMGGLPRYLLLSLSIPRRRGLDSRFFESLVDGMAAWASSYGAHLAGGDTTASPGPLVVDVFLAGEVEKGRALLRSGARVGDLLMATGTLGDSAAGLACLKGGGRKVPAPAASLLRKRHLQPLPQVLAGRWLSKNRAASACIDVSDGLASEVRHLAEAGGVGFEVDAAKVPLSSATLAAARALGKDPLDWALGGGEDYQLLFTAPPSRVPAILKGLGSGTGARVSVLGRAVPKRKGLNLIRDGKRGPLGPAGYAHF